MISETISHYRILQKLGTGGMGEVYLAEDIKPDNIMITRDGHAKVLDFGLAKLVEQRPTPGADSSEVATAVMPQHSTPGSVMGTVRSPGFGLGIWLERDVSGSLSRNAHVYRTE